MKKGTVGRKADLEEENNREYGVVTLTIAGDERQPDRALLPLGSPGDVRCNGQLDTFWKTVTCREM